MYAVFEDGSRQYRVSEGDVVEGLRSSEPGEDGLAERDFDVDNLILQENLLAAHGCVLGVFGGESPGHDAHPEEKGTSLSIASDLGEANRVDARPLDSKGIKVLVDLST